MKSMSLLAAALLAAADALPERIWEASLLERQDPAVIPVQQPKTPPTLSGSTVQGCFKSSGDLKFQTVIQWNSIGSCGNDICRAQGFPVGGTTSGNQCWCGQTYPPKRDEVDPDECNVGCTGFGEHACGGIDFWTIYNTGLALKVEYLGGDEENETTSTTAPASTPSPTAPASTIIVTETPQEESTSGGTNVAGIVAGVVVGVVVFVGVLAGGFLYMRKKRNQEIEEEHRRNAAVNAFIGKPPGSSGGLSMTDSRMDPVMAHRRMSDGSIADNQDYSRRILRVS
ncbi:Cell wall integrity and stress response component 1 [Madurella fahalii]|uniref:Cell wall integrity and stress response component 1 n=1 Tax=Madurella fahalii TaxID=1157608 RepID=A0ABQ0GJC0_9PEZI